MVAASFFRIAPRRISALLTFIVWLHTTSSPAQVTPAPRFQSVTPGLDYARLQITNQPWSIHIARLDRNQKFFDLVGTLGRNRAQGLATVSAQVATIPKPAGRPVVAVNADFFSTRGDPAGLFIRDGEFVSAPADVTFWVGSDRRFHIERISPELEVRWPSGTTTRLDLNALPRTNRATLFTAGYGPTTPTGFGGELILEKIEGSPWLPLRPNQTYRARLREFRDAGGAALTNNLMALGLSGYSATNAARLKPGDTLTFTTALSRDLRDARLALGGGPLLVKNGKAEPWPVRSASNPYVPRHPRTALGFNARHLFLVVVDGRQPKLSIGMSMNELAEFMAQLGCTDAMNLDGGGSATFWLNGKVMNSPSDGRERAVANALIIVEKSR